MSKTCPFCNATLNDEDAFCISCGKPYKALAFNPVQTPASNQTSADMNQASQSPTQASVKTCKCCGATIKSSDSFCSYCGNPCDIVQTQTTAPASHATAGPQNSPWNTPIPEGTTIVTSNQSKEDVGAKVLCLFLQIALCVTPFLPLFRFGGKKDYVGFSSFNIITGTASSYLEYIRIFRNSISGLDVCIVVFIITSLLFLIIAILGAILALANISFNSKKFWNSIIESSSAILLESLGMFVLVYLINRALFIGTRVLTGYGSNLYTITVLFYLIFAAELVVYLVARHFAKKYKFVK